MSSSGPFCVADYLPDCITICNEVAVRDTRNSTSANLLTLPYMPVWIFLRIHLRTEAHLYGMTFLTILGSVPHYPVFCPGFQKGRVPSEKGTLAR